MAPSPSWPPLRDHAPDAAATALRFGEEFFVPATAASLDRPGRLLRLAFEVLPQTATRRDWWFFVHVRDAQGRTIAQGDFRMEQLGMPTSRWAPGKRVLLERAVALPPGTAGKVSAVVGIHDPGWRKRLRLPGNQTETVVWQGEL